MSIDLKPTEREYIEQILKGRPKSTRRQRARVLLLLAKGEAPEFISQIVGIPKAEVEALEKQFATHRIAVLDRRVVKGIEKTETPKIIAMVHEIKGGGYWADVPGLPGCVAQAETLEDLHENIMQAIDDWLAESRVKTEEEAKQLAAIQGSNVPVDKSFPLPYEYLPPSSWTDEDE